MTSVFPPYITADILSRLPVKSLLRFRCVSKPWCGLIDSHDFKKLHLNRSINTNSNLHLILGFNGTRSVSIDSLDSAKPLNPPVDDSSYLNSCNGLILALAKNPYLWNPFTRKFKELPHSPIEYPAGCHVKSVFETYAFSYVSETDDYKVLRVVEFKDVYGCRISSEAKVFSLRSNAWKRIEGFPCDLPYKRVWGVHLNGVLHTVVKTGVLVIYDWSIMAFDARNESHVFLPKPNLTGKNVDPTVEVFGGCLCLLHPQENYHMDIWIMKEYGVKDSWCKLLSVAPPLVRPYVTLYPLVYSKDGAKVLLNHDDKQLMWYDLKRKTVRKVKVKGLPKMFYAELCVESLVSFDDFTSKDDGKETSQADVKKQSQDRRRKGKSWCRNGYYDPVNIRRCCSPLDDIVFPNPYS